MTSERVLRYYKSLCQYSVGGTLVSDSIPTTTSTNCHVRKTLFSLLLSSDSVPTSESTSYPVDLGYPRDLLGDLGTDFQ